ncbi:hypothetical protein L6452_17990 [Arctium lappa]|uniref:Uncharacterized protein n=1 Tax=Arctium lappa TaxID=4217 RepID=A0ACB9C4W9_ARCLA|nr:hypothetical protein L6452_17990 [Arctium lappa]
MQSGNHSPSSGGTAIFLLYDGCGCIVESNVYPFLTFNEEQLVDILYSIDRSFVQEEESPNLSPAMLIACYFLPKCHLSAPMTHLINLKDVFEFQLIHELCLYVLSASQRTELIRATLATLHAFLSWIPLGYIFESPLVAALNFGDFYNVQYVNMYNTYVELSIRGGCFLKSFAVALVSFLLLCSYMYTVLPTSTNIPDAYAQGSSEEQVAHMISLPGAFPAVVAGAVQALFDRISELDMECLTHLIVWFSHLLSNFQFIWPGKYGLMFWSFQAPRVLVQEVLDTEVRLSYWDKVNQLVPDFRYDSEEEITLNIHFQQNLMSVITAGQSAAKAKAELDAAETELMIIAKAELDAAETELMIIVQTYTSQCKERDSAISIIAEFIATLLLHYITVLTVIGYKSQTDPSQCGGVGSLGITSSSFIALPVILPRAVMSCTLWLNAWVQSVKSFQKTYYHNYSGGANELADGYSKGTGLGAEMIGTFVLVYTVFSATDPKRNASDSHVPVLAPLPIGFAAFMVHLATILITAPESTQLVVLVPPSSLEKTKPGMINNLVVNSFTLGGSGSSGLPSGLDCRQRNFPCNRGAPRYSDFGINYGGPPITSSSQLNHEQDNEVLGQPNVYSLFQTARLSAGSLRYYGLGLENGNYTVSLQFAELQIENGPTWRSLGRRVFDIYLQISHPVAIIAEFIATLLLHYITVLTVIGYKSQTDPSQCGGVGSLGITSSSFIALPVILPRAVMSCTLWLNAWVQSVKSFQKTYYHNYSGGANELADGYSKGTGLGAEMIGTFVLVYTVFSATDPKRNASDSHVPVLAPLPIGFAVFMVHLATILITAPESTQLVVLVPPSSMEKTKPGMINNLVVNSFTLGGSGSSGLPSGLDCRQRNFPCNRGAPRYSDFGINCGGPPITSSSQLNHEQDNEVLVPGTYYLTSERRWGVSNVGQRDNPMYTASSRQQDSLLDL